VVTTRRAIRPADHWGKRIKPDILAPLVDSSEAALAHHAIIRERQLEDDGKTCVLCQALRMSMRGSSGG
jgi:hypothetical protein